MSGFFKSLGKSLAVPVIEETVNTVTDGTAGVVGYVSQNFDLPNTTQKAAELGNKLLNSGTITDFNSIVSTPENIDSSLVEATQAAADRELAATRNQIPANVFSGSQKSTNDRKVIIRQEPAVRGGLDTVVFDVMPRIDERGGADYEAIQPIHHPGVIQKYRYSTARSWSISTKLISRTSAEATRTLLIMNTIRSWRMPFYGEGTAQRMPSYLGAPPPILTLTAFGEAMIGPVKCVMKDYSWSFDNAVDYITATDGTAVPVILEIQLSLEESWSPAEMSSFSLTDYKSGNMTVAYRNRMGNAYTPDNNEVAVAAQADMQAEASQTSLNRSEPTNLDGKWASANDKWTGKDDKWDGSEGGNVQGARANTDIYGNDW